VAGNDLLGFTVAVTADRRRDEQTVLLERLGAEVLIFPLLRTEPADVDALRALTESVVAAPPDYFVANTGYGMRTWLQLAGEWGLQGALVGALSSRSTIVVRGAKALGEIRKVGLDAVYRAPGETLEEVVGRLSEEDLAGASIVVQLHGEAAGPVLARLEQAGAKVSYLPVYSMGGGDSNAAGALIDALLERRVDAVTFTAAPQVHVLAGVADAQGRLGAVLDAFNVDGVVAACIGPVCAQGARLAGVTQPLVPEHPRLGSLTSALASYLAGRGRIGGRA
jgi:uroporphyrinogen-III synthase